MNSPATLSPRRQYAVFGVIALALLMSAIDSTMLAVGLRTIADDLQTNIVWIGWTLTAYQLGQVVILPMAGKLSDQIGRRKVFLGAVVVFTASSIACGFAPNVYALIFFRVIQAIGGGAFLPSASGIIADGFGQRRQTALGLFTSIFPIGFVIGPNVAGVILTHFSWRWLFFINGPVGILLLLLGTRLLPRDATAARRRRRIDFLGAGYFAAALLSVMFALTIWANNPEQAGRPWIWLLFLSGIALIVLFLRHEGRVTEPMVEVKLLTWRPLFAANAYNFLYGALAVAPWTFIPYYAVERYGMSVSESGAMLTGRSIMMISVSAMSSFALIKFGYRIPMLLGLACTATCLALVGIGFSHVVILGWPVPDPLLLLVIVALGGIGSGFTGPAANNATIELVPDKIAALAGLRGMFRSSGGLFGTTAFVLAMSQFADQGAGMQRIFLTASVLFVATSPLIFLIPDAARERRKNELAMKTAVAPQQRG